MRHKEPIKTRTGKIAAAALLTLAAASSTSCGGGTDTKTPPSSPDYTKLTSSCFTANPTTPVMTRGTPDTTAAGFAADWNDPSVIKVGNQYWMYASSDDGFDINVKIYRLTSSDGKSWTLNPTTPVLDANASATAWDHKSVETPSVVYYNGQYHMFYTAYPADYTQIDTYRIGHATSPDGITWTRDASNPVVSPTDPFNTAPNATLDFNQWITAEPAAVVFNNKIYLYFSAFGANTTVGAGWQVIGLTTYDGSTWSAQESVLTPDTGIYPCDNTGSGCTSWQGYSTPMAVVLNGEMHLFFDVAQASPWKQVRLHHAKSSDGKTNWTQDSAAIYDTTSFSWADEEIRSPSVLLDGTTLHMWFAGHTGVASPVLSIGHSECAL